MTVGTSSQIQSVVDLGIIPALLPLLRSHNDDMQEHAVRVLGNIAGDSTECRDHALAAGVLQPLLALCTRDTKITMQRDASWLLANLCFGTPQPEFALGEPARPVLAELIATSADEGTLANACHALSGIIEADVTPEKQQVRSVTQTGVVPKLVGLLSHENDQVRHQALRAIGSICAGNVNHITSVLRCDDVPDRLRVLLDHQNTSIRSQACWVISNITAGSSDQIELVIRANIIPPLVSILSSEDGLAIQKEAACAISNAVTGGTDAQIHYLANQGVVHPLCDLLLCTDEELLLAILWCLERLLCVCAADAVSDDPKQAMDLVAIIIDTLPSALDRLKTLRHHANEVIANTATQIMQTYFNTIE